ncbi:unnamed protein product [Lampetra fluviatilis]
MNGHPNAKTMINVTSGDSAKMVCSYVAAANVTFTQMEWTKTKDNTVAILNPNNMIYIPDDYLGRVTMGVLHDEASEIVISNVTPADEGDYKCSVTTFPPAAREMHFTLKVNGFKPGVWAVLDAAIVNPLRNKQAASLRGL